MYGVGPEEWVRAVLSGKGTIFSGRQLLSVAAFCGRGASGVRDKALAEVYMERMERMERGIPCVGTTTEPVRYTPTDETERLWEGLRAYAKANGRSIAGALSGAIARLLGEAAPAPEGKGADALRRAIAAVNGVLPPGKTVRAEAVLDCAERAGVSKRTVYRAKKALGVTSRRVGYGPNSYVVWCRPG